MDIAEDIFIAPARKAALEAMLDQAGWGEATLTMLAGDASFRKYYRATQGNAHAVVMDAPPEKEDTAPFVAITEYLTEIALHPPHIIAQDAQAGFLLLEDLGDKLFNPLLAKEPAQEIPLYMRAMDVLLHLHNQQPADVPAYDEAVLMREVELFIDWYIPAKGIALPEGAKTEFYAAWKTLFASLHYPQEVTVLRDYHADNLLLCEAEEAPLKQVGLLDYQDALIGSPAYDIVSLLEDARRVVSDACVAEMLAHYHKHSRFEEAKLMHDYAVLAAQRNIKILGIFARLAARDNKPHYLDYLPRVWRYVTADLARPALAELQAWCDMFVPVEKRG